MAVKKNREVIMHERDIEKTSQLQIVKTVFGTFFRYLFLLIVAFVVLFPFYWMIISSLKSLPECGNVEFVFRQ